MDGLFLPLAKALGASVDQIKVITCLLLSYPLAAVYTRLNHPNLKHLFSIAVSVFYLLPVFHLWNGTAQLLFSVLATYILSSTVHGRKMPWIVFAVVMGHLTLNHLYRAFYEISLETFEITGPQMVLTMKLTTFAWNVYDGRQPAESLDKWQTEKRIVKMPSLLAFLGYSFYFPGFLVGPYLEYANYSALTSQVDDFNKSTKGKEKAQAPPGQRRAALWRLVQGIVFLGLFVLYGPSFNYQIILSDWWLKQTWWYRIVCTQIIGFFERTKYYAIWRLTEGAAIATGLGFTGAGNWSGAANVDITVIEWPSNFKVLLDAWNMKTNVWLRECIYKRVTPKGKKPGFRSSMLTFATSAFWHGVAGGYYMTFVFGGFIQTAQRSVRQYVRPLLLAPVMSQSTSRSDEKTYQHPILKAAYDLLGTVSSLLILNYAVIPFSILNVRESIYGWNRVYWYGHIMVGGTLLVFWSGGVNVLKSMQKRRFNAASKNSSTNGFARATGVDLDTKSPRTPGSAPIIAPVDIAADKLKKN